MSKRVCQMHLSPLLAHPQLQLLPAQRCNPRRQVAAQVLRAGMSPCMRSTAAHSCTPVKARVYRTSSICLESHTIRTRTHRLLLPSALGKRSEASRLFRKPTRKRRTALSLFQFIAPLPPAPPCNARQWFWGGRNHPPALRAPLDYCQLHSYHHQCMQSMQIKLRDLMRAPHHPLWLQQKTSGTASLPQ